MAKLGDLERQVMDVLWAEGSQPMSVRQVSDCFTDHAYTTLLTVLDRLEAKGLVQRTMVGRAYQYSAAATREDYTSSLLREVLAETTDARAALVRFAQTISDEEAAHLREALEQARASQP